MGPKAVPHEGDRRGGEDGLAPLASEVAQGSSGSPMKIVRTIGLMR